ncbi:MAG: DUF3576 domain-containing protein, partial [Hyphomicrobiales bacterium]|nr:DUF3576 domain-containing protein [Hyphomicrobiales bacterium]
MSILNIDHSRNMAVTSSPSRTLGFIRRLCMVCVFALLAGCAVDIDKEQDFPEFESRDSYRERLENLEGGKERVFGDLSLGGDEKKRRGAGESFSTVNYYLWRATLETLDLGPLESADPFGGVIITDWFSLEEEP